MIFKIDGIPAAELGPNPQICSYSLGIILLLDNSSSANVSIWYPGCRSRIGKFTKAYISNCPLNLTGADIFIKLRFSEIGSYSLEIFKNIYLNRYKVFNPRKKWN